MPGVKITTDTSKENAFIVPLKNGKEMKFQNCNDGLYYYDTKVVIIVNRKLITMV